MKAALLARCGMIAGGLVIAASLLWWWATYQDVIHYDYLGMRQASLCLVTDTEICRLARALCRGTHPRAILNYSNLALWLGVVLLSCGLLTSPPAWLTKR